MSGCRRGPSWRVVSPSGGSILITSAAEVTELLRRPRAQYDRGAVENAHAIERSRHTMGSLDLSDAASPPPGGERWAMAPDTVRVTDLSRTHVEMLPGGGYGRPEGGA